MSTDVYSWRRRFQGCRQADSTKAFGNRVRRQRARREPRGAPISEGQVEPAKGTPRARQRHRWNGVGEPRCQASRNILLTHWGLWLSPHFPCAVKIAPARCFQGTLVNSVNQVFNIYAQSVLEEGTIFTKPEIHPLVKTRILLE